MRRVTSTTLHTLVGRTTFLFGAGGTAADARLRSKVEYTSLPAFLLPEEFTLVDLQRVYEIVLGRLVNKSALRTRVMAADLVTEVPRQRSGPTRPAQLYRLKDRHHPVFLPRTFSPCGE